MGNSPKCHLHAMNYFFHCHSQCVCIEHCMMSSSHMSTQKEKKNLIQREQRENLRSFVYS